jgi:aspartate/methionine/tyrosine aminotransferase
MNKLNNLIEYPFTKLKHLLEGSKSNFHGKIIDMSLGEPQHPVPKILIEALEKNSRFWNKYPPVNGTLEYRQAIVNWFTNRYSLNKKFLDPDLNVLPLSGTREGLYSLAHLAADLYDGQKEFIAMADPFYQTYHAAAIMSDSKPLLLTAKEENNFLPRIDELDEDILNKVSLFYLCSPTNPQGASADYQYIHKVISLANRHNFIVAFDECYSEIYFKSPPTGALSVCQDNNLSLKNIVVFNSLSKRSNAAGLRSGFIVGDPNIIFQFSRMRSFGCAGTPIAILNATIALLEDEKHVKENRELYLEKFIDSERILKDYSGFNLPDGAIFLWIKVNDAEVITKRIWSEAGVKVIPGSFFSQKKGEPQTEYIRVAMVNDYLTTQEGITRISKILKTQ